jgi:hypothetical protein
MSWLYSQALVAEFSRAACSDGDASVPSKSTGTDGMSYELARTTGRSTPSLYGMTSQRSTDDPGAALLRWYLAGFPVRPFPRQLEAETLQRISGRSSSGSWQMSLLHSSGRRVLRALSSTRRLPTSSRWATRPAALPLPRETWVRTTFGHAIGSVHTPTATANYTAPSMQKWPGCRAFVTAFGKPSPEIHEWLMGWPQGWTDLKPLARERFRSWQQRHGA